MPKFPIVGMQFRPSEGIPAPTIMTLLPPGTPLYLVRQPDNQFDENAIQVWIADTLSAVGSEGAEDIKASCVDKEGTPYECPDLSSPLMLGFIKAKSIDDEVQGSDILAPRIDALVQEGQIEDASQIPCELIYGESGKPALRIKSEVEPGAANPEPTGEAVEAESADLEADRAFLNGDDQLAEEDEVDLEDIEAGEADETFGEEPN